ncbi:hypothetical protein BBP40_001770 [Aspergillus hancockii]|nr:hypothetical protein BBP40_001770 [Aspergillus hancockii]
MALRTSADNAEDVAAGFRAFRNHLPEHETEITSLIADLFAISSHLKRLNDLTNDRRCQHKLPSALPDLELVRTSLKFTLEDIVDFFGDLEVRRGSTRDVYRRTWIELCEFFREQSRDSLATRLAKYKTLLNELEDFMKDLKELLVQQNNQFAHQLGSMSLSTPSSPSTNSAEPASPVSDRRPRNRSSKCLGEPTPGVKRWLQDEGFEELFQLAFSGDSDLRVFFTIEHMVLFFCTFLALRSQDCGRPVDRIRDYELDDEEELFGGPIVDDNFLHALRIYRDRTSGAVRLQASVHKGEMKRAPVWTAFITNHICTRGWIRRADSKVILLRELHQMVFTFEHYDPPRTSRGEHILKFSNRSDAQGFVDTIAELAGHSLTLS